MLSRRTLLKSSGLALAATASAPSFLLRAAAAEKRAGKTLVALFQRGAVDGLNMVVPYSEERYYDLRPNLAIARPGAEERAAVDLDGRFGLHPAMAALKPLWKGKSLAVVHAVGSPDSTRSHFDAQDYMESGTPGDKGTRDGWLNRYLASAEPPQPSPLRAVAVGEQMARALQGEAAAVAINRVRDFRLAGGSPQLAEAFRALWGQAAEEAIEQQLQRSSAETFEALRLLEQVRASGYRPANGASYPNGRVGSKLQQIAQLIKADIGLEVAFADSGGWDTHTNQGPQLNNLLGEFARSIAAFAQDLGDRMADVTLLTMSEFGRTARENGNRGTDHGHANALFVMGGGVKGGKVYGEWPGLGEEQLYERRDLALTSDFRDVFAEALTKTFDTELAEEIFPGHEPAKPLGLMG
jgi:uncharacterized protein (DUF1501 family)